MKKSLLFTLMLAAFLDIGNFFMPTPLYTPLFLHSALLGNYSMEARSVLLGILMACYGFAQLLGAPIFGEISDQYGRKKAILLSMGSAIVGCVLGGISLTEAWVPLIFFSRLLIGFSSGTIAVVFAAAADNSTEATRAKIFGYINFGLAVGVVIGPIIGGHLVNVNKVSAAGYALPFYFMALLYVLNIALLLKMLPDDKGSRAVKKRIHLFTAFQNLHIVMSRSSYLFWLVLGALFFQIGTEAFYLAAPIVAVKQLHMTPPLIANYFIIFGIVGAMVSLVINAVVNRIFKNPRRIYVTCIVCYTSIGFLMFAHSAAGLLLPFLSIGVFGVLAWIQVNNLFSQSVGEQEQGLALGISQLAWSMGGIIGTFLIGVFSAAHHGVMVSLPFLFILASVVASIFMLVTFKQHRVAA